MHLVNQRQQLRQAADRARLLNRHRLLPHGDVLLADAIVDVLDVDFGVHGEVGLAKAWQPAACA